MAAPAARTTSCLFSNELHPLEEFGWRLVSQPSFLQRGSDWDQTDKVVMRERAAVERSQALLEGVVQLPFADFLGRGRGP